MKINQLRYFVSACKHQNITMASKEHFISQPSVTNAIKELEQEFGLQLIHRLSKGFTLTTEGQILYKKAEELLAMADNISELMSDLGSNRNIIHLGIPPMVATMLFPRIYAGFNKKYPSIDVISIESGTPALLEGIIDETLDIAIIPKRKFTNGLDSVIPKKNLVDDFEYIDIYKTELQFCVSKKNLLAEYTSISINQLKDQPIVLLKEGFIQNEEIKKLFANAGLEPHIIHRSAQFSTIREFAKRNLAAVPMYKEVIKNDIEIHGLSLDPPIEIEVVAVWKKNRRMYSDSLKLLDFLKKL